jgi:hypothetical protein
MIPVHIRAAALLALPLFLAGMLAGVTPASSSQPTGATSAVSSGAGEHYTYRSFVTPSGNIRCAAWRSGGKWSMRCDVYEHFWTAPPGSCPDFGDYGSFLGMSKRGWPEFICASDAIDATNTLYYGQKWRAGPFKCKSRSSGLKCRNKKGHGWFLSRETYRTF